MNELRELNAVEMSAVEGGAGPLDEFLAAAWEAIQSLFSSAIIGPIIEAVNGFIDGLRDQILAFLDGLFGGSQS